MSICFPGIWAVWICTLLQRASGTWKCLGSELWLYEACKEHPLLISALHKHHFAAQLIPLGDKCILVRGLGAIGSGRSWMSLGDFKRGMRKKHWESKGMSSALPRKVISASLPWILSLFYSFFFIRPPDRRAIHAWVQLSLNSGGKYTKRCKINLFGQAMVEQACNDVCCELMLPPETFWIPWTALPILCSSKSQ